jgi:NADH:ubiquinone oxidoreductase subunit 3 (subunit A)
MHADCMYYHLVVVATKGYACNVKNVFVVVVMSSSTPAVVVSVVIPILVVVVVALMATGTPSEHTRYKYVSAYDYCLYRWTHTHTCPVVSGRISDRFLYMGVLLFTLHEPNVAFLVTTRPLSVRTRGGKKIQTVG